VVATSGEGAFQMSAADSNVLGGVSERAQIRMTSSSVLFKMKGSMGLASITLGMCRPECGTIQRSYKASDRPTVESCVSRKSWLWIL
jgi:hypothetical protein